MIDENALKWRNLLLEFLEPHTDIPVLLSGGMDSSTILAALLELGRKPEVYHFRLGSRESSDFINVKKTVALFDLRLHVIPIEETPETLISDVHEILDVVQSTHKTIVQTVHPIKYLLAHLKKEGHSSALDGVPGIVDLTRRSKIIWRSKDAVGMQKFRKDLSESPGQGSYGNIGIDVYAKYQGISLIHPYLYQPLVDYSLSLSMDDMNSPVLKGIALRAFPEFYEKNPIWKENADLQVVSGIKEWHQTLLQDTSLNRYEYKNVLGVYNTLLKEKFPKDTVPSGGGTLSKAASPVLKILQDNPNPWPRKGARGKSV